MKIRELAAAAALPVVSLAANPLLDLISANNGCESVMVSFAGSLSEVVTYKELSSSSCKVCSPLGATAYHLLASDQGAQRGPFEAVVDADREVDCTKSLAFATSTSLGKVYSTPLKQAGSFTSGRLVVVGVVHHLVRVLWSARQQLAGDGRRR